MPRALSNAKSKECQLHISWAAIVPDARSMTMMNRDPELRLTGLPQRCYLASRRAALAFGSGLPKLVNEIPAFPC